MFSAELFKTIKDLKESCEECEKEECQKNKVSNKEEILNILKDRQEAYANRADSIHERIVSYMREYVQFLDEKQKLQRLIESMEEENDG